MSSFFLPAGGYIVNIVAAVPHCSCAGIRTARAAMGQKPSVLSLRVTSPTNLWADSTIASRPLRGKPLLLILRRRP